MYLKWQPRNSITKKNDIGHITFVTKVAIFTLYLTGTGINAPSLKSIEQFYIIPELTIRAILYGLSL